MSVKFSQNIQIKLSLILFIKKKISEHSLYTYLHVEHISSQKIWYYFIVLLCFLLNSYL